jgi:hypothetical protein
VICSGKSGFAPRIASKDNPHDISHAFSRNVVLMKALILIADRFDDLQLFDPYSLKE